MAPRGLPPQGTLLTPPGASNSDLRNNPRIPGPGPVTAFDLSSRRSEPCEIMEKIPPITGKRRGGNRKACNECKQQKVGPICLAPVFGASPSSLQSKNSRFFISLNMDPWFFDSFGVTLSKHLRKHARDVCGLESNARLKRRSSGSPSEGKPAIGPWLPYLCV